MECKTIGWIESDFKGKFGIPRQSGLVEALTARLLFAPEFRNPDALRGVEGFSHLWLLWEFSLARRPGGGNWSPTVRPPRLGGNRRVGVFATRSPFRPNSIGLSCVRLLGLGEDPALGPFLAVAGADLADGTPILDIKPYLPYADCHPEAVGGFAADPPVALPVRFAVQPPVDFPPDRLAALEGVLALDPRPPYQTDPERVYGMDFAGHAVRFTVGTAGVTVVGFEPQKNPPPLQAGGRKEYHLP